MKKLIVFFLTIIFLLSAFTALYANEDFFIVTEAPIAVGGGMIRYCQNLRNGYVSIRYSYGGTVSDYILIDKVTRFSLNNSSQKELVKVPLKDYQGKRTGFLQVGSYNVRLHLNKYNRVIVEKVE